MTRDANKQSAINCSGHDWIKTDIYDNAIAAAQGQRAVCSLCGHFPMASQFEQADAIVTLKDLIKPGDTLHTQIKTVSRSGMSRVIQVIKIGCSENGEPSLSYLGYNVALALDWKYDKDRDGVKVGGCGMDMGFHLPKRSKRPSARRALALLSGTALPVRQISSRPAEPLTTGLAARELRGKESDQLCER